MVVLIIVLTLKSRTFERLRFCKHLTVCLIFTSGWYLKFNQTYDFDLKDKKSNKIY